MSWATTNATSCTGSEGFSGAQPINGSVNFTPTTGGQYKYTMTCTGVGGIGSNSQTVIVPIPVQKTSYLNFKNNGQGQTTLPMYTHAMAYGDFFQDGTISLMISPVIADQKIPTDFNKNGMVYFYKKINGLWIDKTSEILADRTGCVWPRKAVSADFNGDGKPDIFLACHGFDAPPFAGEKQILLLSQANGNYKHTLLDIFCYCHGATAADFKGDGYADIVITDTGSNYRQPMYLSNNRDGTFKASSSELDKSIEAFSFPNQSVKYARGIYSVEFIDANADGSPDLFMAGNDIDWQGRNETQSLGAFTPKIFFNHDNKFNKNYVSIPIDSALPVSLDVVIESNILWMLKTDYNNPSFKIQQFDLNLKVEGTPKSIPNNGVFWIIHNPIKGIVTAG